MPCLPSHLGRMTDAARAGDWAGVAKAERAVRREWPEEWGRIGGDFWDYLRQEAGEIMQTTGYCVHGVPMRAWSENCQWGCPEGCAGDNHREGCHAGIRHRRLDSEFDQAMKSDNPPNTLEELARFLW